MTIIEHHSSAQFTCDHDHRIATPCANLHVLQYLMAQCAGMLDFCRMLELDNIPACWPLCVMAPARATHTNTLTADMRRGPMRDVCSVLPDGDLAQGWLPPPQRYTHPSINADVHHASTPILDQFRRRVTSRMG